MKNWKRCLSVVMTLAMLVGVLPTAAFAEGGDDPVPLTDPTITLTPSSTEYTGGDITVTVKVDGMTGYTVTCPDAKSVSNDSITVVNAGTYTVTATPTTGEYITGEFTINPKPISDLDISVDSTEQIYNGEARTPAVTVKHGETITLQAGTDYTLDYIGNTNAGKQAKVTITAVNSN